MIILYDIPSTLVGPAGPAWSPNTWKARFVLNYKRLSYKTVWVEYPDIEEQCKSIGAKHTMMKLIDPTKEHYTLPVIHDQVTGTVVSESIDIIRYLEEAYPDAPKVISPGTLGLCKAFPVALGKNIESYYPFAMPLTAKLLNPPSAEYFYRTRSLLFQKDVKTDLYPKDSMQSKEWTSFKAGLDRVDKWYEPGALYLSGEEKPALPDFITASYIIWMKLTLGEESEEWKQISTWNDGRWGRLLTSLVDYQK